jgi:release factor glutamine methyltransferase
VEAALALPHGARVVDVGTGSGAVALALKDERPDLEVVATDVSADALDVARANARRLGLDVSLLEGDLLSPVTGKVDAVISNPPYVAEHERASLPPDVARHEPHGALFAGADGLDLIRRLIPEALAREAGLIALEVGATQAAGVRDLLSSAGYGRTEVIADLAGIERVVVASR